LNTRNAYYLVAAATFAALTASAPRADVTQSVIATANATVKPAGPRTGTSGLKYFNVEGSANTTNASYGVLRFDSSSLKSAFDTQYGAGAYSITDLTLSLVEANSPSATAKRMSSAISGVRAILSFTTAAIRRLQSSTT